MRIAFGAVGALRLAGARCRLRHCAQWQPTRPVEFIIPAGTGGGADLMARTIQGIVTKHNLMKTPMVVINKAGGAGGEGFLDVKNSRNNPHKIIITLSNLFTTPLATGIPFNWKDLTPVAMLALDEFVLWVNAETPYKSVEDYIGAVKKAPPGQYKMGGTGSRQEDQIITVAIEKSAGREVHLHPVPRRRRGRGAARRQSRQLDRQQSERGGGAVARRQGAAAVRVRRQAACLHRHHRRQACRGSSIPTCKSQGLNMEYLMLRGIFMAPGATPDQVNFYVELFKKVRETPEWKKLMSDGAFNQTFMTGAEYVKWVAGEEQRHRELMKEAGFLAK